MLLAQIKSKKAWWKYNWPQILSFSGVGYGQAIATSSVVSYYTCLIAMSVFYLIASCQSVLPWTVCDPEIVLNNTICVGTGQNATQLLADGGNFYFFIYLFFFLEIF